MPPLDSAVREQGFRLQPLGFHKDDVLAYISSLAAESQQQEELYQEQLRQLQAQIEKLKSDQSSARACVEKLQQELTAAGERAELAEKQYDEAARKLAESEKRAAELAARSRENQQSANEWQFKCHDLERLLQEAQAAAPPPPAPPAAPAPAPVRTAEDARVEARRILADARLTAENAEKRLAGQAEAQKQKMAEDARGITAGILVLKDRLARVDARLDAASLDLENATASIYQALEQTEGDLKELTVQLEDFGAAPAAAPAAEIPAASSSPEAAHRQKATARRGRSARQPAPKSTAHRLRRASRTPVSQELLAALDRLDEP